MNNESAVLTRVQKAAATRAENRRIKELDVASTAALLAVSLLPDPAVVEAQAQAAAAEEAANLAAEAAELKREAQETEAVTVGYIGPMLRLRERLKLGKYIKAPNGQPCCADRIAATFGTLKPEQTIAACIIALGLGHNPYSMLNVGQQSMNLRNRVRNALKRGEFGFGVVTEAVEEVTGTPVAIIEDEQDDDSDE